MGILPLITVFLLSFSTLLVLRFVRRSSLGRTISKLIPFSVLSSYTSLIATRLQWALDVSLDLAFFGHSLQPPAVPLLTHHELSISSYGSMVTADGEAGECTICLCKMEPGDEIRELRCSHLFHGVCLDRWLGSNRLSCPLCRGSVAPWRAISELGEEVLFFKFCDFSSDSGGDRWWLR